MGFDESIYAALLVGTLLDFLKTHDLGKIVGADGMMRIFPGMVRIPDTAFISWARFPKRKRRRGDTAGRSGPYRGGAQQGKHTQGNGPEAR